MSDPYERMTTMTGVGTNAGVKLVGLLASTIGVLCAIYLWLRVGLHPVTVAVTLAAALTVLVSARSGAHAITEATAGRDVVTLHELSEEIATIYGITPQDAERHIRAEVTHLKVVNFHWYYLTGQRGAVAALKAGGETWFTDPAADDIKANVARRLG